MQPARQREKGVDPARAAEMRAPLCGA